MMLDQAKVVLNHQVEETQLQMRYPPCITTAMVVTLLPQLVK